MYGDQIEGKQVSTKAIQTTLSRPNNIVCHTSVLYRKNGNIFSVNCSIENTKLQLLLDTGSDISVISLKSIDDIRRDVNLDIKMPDLTCQAAGGQPMKILGKTRLQVNINGRLHPFMFYIIKDLLCQGLIGLDFFLAYRACLNAISLNEVTLSLDEYAREPKQTAANVVMINTKIIQQEYKGSIGIKISTFSDCIVQPYSYHNLKIICPQNLENGPYELTQTDAIRMKLPTIDCAKSIFLIKDKITKLSVRNFGGHPVKIFASTTMGYVHRESKHILGLFSKNNGETLDKHNSAKICQNKSPGQAKHDVTKGAFQTNSRQKPESDYI